MNPSEKKESLLQKLGDNWHVNDPYIALIRSVVPDSNNVLDIQDILLHMYGEEHFNFKRYKNASRETFFSEEIECAIHRIKELEGLMKKESEVLDKLAEKFEEVEEYLEHTSNDVDEDEDDDGADYVAAPTERGKGNMIKAKTKKLSPQEEAKILEEKRKIRTARNTKIAMATTQEKLIEYQREIEFLTNRNVAYKHYHEAELGRKFGINKLVLEYEKSGNIQTVIQGLDTLLTYYEMIRRRNISSAKCSGKPKDFCETHYLPLYVTKYTEKGDPLIIKCDVSPV